MALNVSEKEGKIGFVKLEIEYSHNQNQIFKAKFRLNFPTESGIGAKEHYFKQTQTTDCESKLQSFLRAGLRLVLRSAHLRNIKGP